MQSLSLKIYENIYILKFYPLFISLRNGMDLCGSETCILWKAKITYLESFEYGAEEERMGRETNNSKGALRELLK